MAFKRSNFLRSQCGLNVVALLLLSWRLGVGAAVLEAASSGTGAQGTHTIQEPSLTNGDLGKLDAYIHGYLRKHRIPGVAVSVVQGTNVVFAKGFGEGITAQTLFRLASVSKSFTALAIMQLVEAGKLDLESPARRYLPWFQTADAELSGQITLRHLLHHRSGISTLDGRIGPSVEPGGREESLVRNYRRLHLTARPGSRFEYSNANYDILGAIVEAVSGQEFGAYIRANIFDPLQMNSSFVSVREARQHGLFGYRYWFGLPIAYAGEDVNPGGIAAGGLVSTVEDLAHYATALMNGGHYEGRSILSPGGVETLFKQYGDGDGREYYAMGWEVHQSEGLGVKVIGHDGAGAEFFSLVSLLPERQLAVAFLANAMSYTRREIPQLAYGVTYVLLGKPTRRVPIDWMVVGATWAVLLLPFLQFVGLWRTLRLIRKWRTGTPPPRTMRDWVRHWGLPLFAHAMVAAVTLWLLPRSFDLTLPRLLVFVPDYGALAAFSGVFAIVWGLVRSALVGNLFLRRDRNSGQVLVLTIDTFG